MFSLDIQKKIKEDIDLLLCFIKTGIINSGFAQRVKEQRLSQEIETYIKLIQLLRTKSLNLSIC